MSQKERQMIISEDDFNIYLNVKNAFENKYTVREAKVGYLTIKTRYSPGDEPVDKEQADLNQIDANAEVAILIRKIVEDKGGCIKGAVVEMNEGTDNQTFGIIVSYKVDPGSLDKIIEEIAQIKDLPVLHSSIKVDRVEKAGKKEPRIPTGLQGPP
jgi:hypothetical protein